MFERWYASRPTPESAALVDRICAAARAENRAAAEQLVVIGQLFAYRYSSCSETDDWAIDTEAAVAAEVGAALRISQSLAASRLRYARALRERLPQVGEVFQAGDIDYRAFTTIVYRSDLITDPDVLATVDRQLAVNVTRWPSMSQGRLGAQVDKIVARADADAVRRRTEQQADREIWIGAEQEGLSQIIGSLFTVDAHALDTRLSALAATVCAHDPRTPAQRRADAMGALVAKADRLGCRCGRPDCAVGTRPAASPVVIHVIAEQATLDGRSTAPASELGADGLITPELVAELAQSATLIPLIQPGDAPPEPGYRPSKALADFVRCRDLTCRWPGCDVPAINCQLDHTIPYADGGPTHAGNLKCYCPTHHRTVKGHFCGIMLGMNTTTNDVIRAGCYLRISSDPDDKRDGVKRQREDTTALCEVKGWTPAGFYEDNDRSASNGHDRPKWEELLADIKAGKIDAIAAWDQDRGWRMMHELEELRRFFTALGRKVPLATTGQGDIDLYSPTGVLAAQIKTAVSEHEIAMMKVRQRRAARQKAEKGLPKWKKSFRLPARHPPQGRRRRHPPAGSQDRPARQEGLPGDPGA